MPGGWSGSTRRDGLPSWWPVTRKRILARDPLCRCPGCPRCSAIRPREECRRPSHEADHIVAGDNHRDENLRGVCTPCHAFKSSREGNAAKRAKRQPTGIFNEKHPGDLW